MMNSDFSGKQPTRIPQHLIDKPIAIPMPLLFLRETNRLLAAMDRGIAQSNYTHIKTAAQELRDKCAQIGAVRFSHLILGIEVAIEEFRYQDIVPIRALIDLWYEQLLIEVESKHSGKTPALGH